MRRYFTKLRLNGASTLVNPAVVMMNVLGAAEKIAIYNGGLYTRW